MTIPPGGISEPRYCHELPELRRGDRTRFGGKSSSLGELLAGGVTVPPGFALSTEAFALFADQSGLQPVIDGQLAALAGGDDRLLASACAKITEAIDAAPVPGPVRTQIARAYDALAVEVNDPAPPVAVRSSALGEDGEAATYAGQQKTLLWVRTVDDVLDAVRSCWASLYSPTAVSYRARLAADDQPLAMGVAVQVMVDARVAGVMFTCNPISGDPSTIAVNASWGLGEAVVAGEVTPDEYRLSKVTGEVLRRSVATKLVEHLPAPIGGGTVAREVPPDRRERPCLSDDELRALFDVAGRVERHFASHQDIEWAFARTGSCPDNLFVLQSRPVTALPKREHKRTPTSALSLVMSQFGADRTHGRT